MAIHRPAIRHNEYSRMVIFICKYCNENRRTEMGIIQHITEAHRQAEAKQPTAPDMQHNP